MVRIYADRVLEISTTEGNGNFQLTGAPAGYQVFSGVCAVGDTFDYTAVHVDGSGVPTGEWETGTGTFTAGDQIARTLQEGSNGAALVNFSAGNKLIFLSQNAASDASGGDGGGGGSLGQLMTDTTQWGQNTDNGGTTIPGSHLAFNVPAGDYVIEYYIHYNNNHAVRGNIYVDGVPVGASNTGDPTLWNYSSYALNVTGLWVLQMKAAVTLTAGAHTIDAYYNAMDATNQGGVQPGSYCTVTPFS